ncbi:coatomer subunit beta'-1-like [Camellia sinensis]|uniref:coatomer subunit beta'-1-like n=1 Tax=Camellia sinensis TaxID=4442 RepID=UPI00103572CE|nr:coatomer subunit beta'-1-like [Camellia sinensis]
MQVTFNPKDTNTFASASLDCTIKIWNLGSPDPNFTLDAHLKGVNCVDYFTGGDKPYLITGSDDHSAKVCCLFSFFFFFLVGFMYMYNVKIFLAIFFENWCGTIKPKVVSRH